MSCRFRNLTQTTIAAGSDVPLADAGSYFTTDNVEGATQEIGAQLAQKASLAYLNEKTGYGVISGLGVTAQSTPDMTVSVATGVIWMANGDRWEPAANNALAVSAANATNPRIDIVYINSSGVIAYQAGTAAATPAQPSTPAGGQLIAKILVTAGKTSILTADITARRKNIWTEEWITPTLLNGATGTVQYRKTTVNRLEFRGTITVVDGSSLFVLPSGYTLSETTYIYLPIEATTPTLKKCLFMSGTSFYSNTPYGTQTLNFNGFSLPLV